jgi:parvulin-like peptidyl-prolyl isomerase
MESGFFLPGTAVAVATAKTVPSAATREAEMERRTGSHRAALALSLLVALFSQQSAASPFAVVGERVINRTEYESALRAAMRQAFYHARPPEGELEAFRREVGERLVNQALLLDEARRRAIQADQAHIEEIVAQYDRRYAGNERWQSARAELLAALVEQLGKQSMLERLERSVRAVPAPDERETRAYYAAHQEQFTEPEQVRVSLIVLRVDPASPRAEWEKAREKALALRARVLGGEDFGELARLHSADPSAAKGGDLGYLHRGMLPDALQAGVIDALPLAQVSEPIGLLEGIALVRVDARKQAKLRAYEEVRVRAAQLTAREKGETAWKKLIASLRSEVPIRVDESVYLSSPPAK